MALDTVSLRVALGAVTLTLLLLSYWVTFRATRSTYSAWWCVALCLFITGSAGYLLDGTVHQVWANPLANTLVVAGATSVWAGARSLRARPHAWWRPLLLPSITAVASALDSPATNVWSGGPVFLAAMALALGLASVELWRLDHGFSWARPSMAAISGLLAVYYFCRWVAFVAVGQDGAVFRIYFGSEITTLMTTVLLVVVSFSMTELSTEQLIKDLRARATQDGLTGLLNRAGFLDVAKAELLRMERDGTAASLILADLDEFKAVNDTWGHGAGDDALRAFAAACRETVRSTDLVGRYGGEEFILLLPGAGPRRAEAITAQVSRELQQMSDQHPFRLPTVSYGIATVTPGSHDLAEAIATADAALYRAKSLGRNQAVFGTDPEEAPEAAVVDGAQ